AILFGISSDIVPMQASAPQVADYLIWLAASERPEEPCFLTPMQLQKLLYYILGWTLAESDRAVFSEPIEAWEHGPVVRKVWESYQRFGAKPISEIPGHEPTLSDADKLAIRDVWDIYKNYTAWELSDMTHDERPWLEAREGLAPSAKGAREISPHALRQTFRSQLTHAE